MAIETLAADGTGAPTDIRRTGPCPGLSATAARPSRMTSGRTPIDKKSGTLKRFSSASSPEKRASRRPRSTRLNGRAGSRTSRRAEHLQRAKVSAGRGETAMLIGFVLGIVFSIVVAVVGAFLTVISGWIPANADAKPGWPEKYAAHNSLRATLAADFAEGPQSGRRNGRELDRGVSSLRCALCDLPRVGGGKVRRSAIAKGEYPEPPQLASNGVEDDPEGWTFRKIQHGIRWTGMPAWKYELPAGGTSGGSADVDSRLSRSIEPSVRDLGRGEPGRRRGVEQVIQRRDDQRRRPDLLQR